MNMNIILGVIMKLIFIDTLTFNKFSEMKDVNASTVVLLNTNKSKTWKLILL